MRIEPEPNSREFNFDKSGSHESFEMSPPVSPELKILDHALATPGRRYLGQILDVIVTWVIFLLFLSLFNEIGISRDLADTLSISFCSVYFVFSDALPHGRSVGKFILGMSVIDKTSGKYCSLWQSFVRNIFNPLIGIIDAIFILSKRRQRIGDLAANTIVIRNK